MNDTGLRTIDEGLWVVDAPLSVLGVHVGTRMTVVRLQSGDLWLHSPVSMSDSLKQKLNELGPVRHIVAPNLFHHLYAGEAVAAFPEAKLYGAAGLAKKRPDLNFDAELGENTDVVWGHEIEQLAIDGTMLRETVFLHKSSGTLITSDLAENFKGSDHWPTRLYLKLQGLEGRFGLAFLLKICYRDKAKSRAGIDRILEADFDRVIVAHGDVLERGGKEKVREAFDWLRAS